MSARRVVTLYSKPGCHLCEELRALLEELRPRHHLAVEEIDITRDGALYALYRHEIPVLFVEGEEVGRGRIDARQLADRLSGPDGGARRQGRPQGQG